VNSSVASLAKLRSRLPGQRDRPAPARPGARRRAVPERRAR